MTYLSGKEPEIRRRQIPYEIGSYQDREVCYGSQQLHEQGKGVTRPEQDSRNIKNSEDYIPNDCPS